MTYLSAQGDLNLLVVKWLQGHRLPVLRPLGNGMRPFCSANRAVQLRNMQMVESGLGIGILPRLILQRTPYKVEIRGFSEPLYREIGLAMRNSKAPSASVRKFAKYLKYRGSK